MAFINHQMSVPGNQIGNLAFFDEALNQRHVNYASRLSFASTDCADLLGINVKERP